MSLISCFKISFIGQILETVWLESNPAQQLYSIIHDRIIIAFRLEKRLVLRLSFILGLLTYVENHKASIVSLKLYSFGIVFKLQGIIPLENGIGKQIS